MKDPYQILGISRDATDIEVKNAYRALARKYHPDNYKSDDPLADLAVEKMKEINEAYDQIMDERRGKANGSSSDRSTYIAIRNLINQKRMREAENMLANIPVEDRTADWHYLESIVLMHRRFVNDAMRELEIACEMDPSNEEYQKAKQMFNQTAGGYNDIYYGNASRPAGQGCSTCDVCQGLICADCCCECMGGDLIPCC